MGGDAGTFAHENAQARGVGGKVVNHIGGGAALDGAGDLIQTATDHLKRERRRQLVQASGHRVEEVAEHGIQAPGSPRLNQYAILRAGPQVGEAKQTFDRIECIFNTPALPIEPDRVGHRQAQHTLPRPRRGSAPPTSASGDGSIRGAGHSPAHPAGRPTDAYGDPAQSRVKHNAHRLTFPNGYAGGQVRRAKVYEYHNQSKRSPGELSR